MQNRLLYMKRLNIKVFYYPVLFWVFFIFMFFLAIVQFEKPADAFRIACLVSLPLIVPVLINDYLFKKFLLKKKVLVYLFLAAVNIIVFGYFIDKLQKYIEPDGNSETYVSIFIFMMTYIGIKYMIEGTKQQFRMKDLETKQAQAELNMLKSQVKPHFLFNSLNSIYSLILQKSDQSGPAVMLLSDLMRYILESSKKKLVPLKGELSFIKNYIELEKLRLGNNFSLEYSVRGKSANLFIAPMILIPFVENVFKHGVSAQSKNEFEIKIELGKEELKFFTSNQIVATQHKLEEKNEKTGIENVKKRLALLYPDDHHLEIDKNGGKFQLNLQLKLKV